VSTHARGFLVRALGDGLTGRFRSPVTNPRANSASLDAHGRQGQGARVATGGPPATSRSERREGQRRQSGWIRFEK
jgi:hypothetical protein